jgi:hypothetical protein
MPAIQTGVRRDNAGFAVERFPGKKLHYYYSDRIFKRKRTRKLKA